MGRWLIGDSMSRTRAGDLLFCHLAEVKVSLIFLNFYYQIFFFFGGGVLKRAMITLNNFDENNKNMLA